MAYVEFDSRPELTNPALVCAFRGWNDGGEASTTAVAYLRDRWGAERIARLDPEEFFDFQVARPTVRLVDGVTRRIDWPENEFFHASLPERDLVLFLGTEPNLRWKTFARAMVDSARELGVDMVVTLGAFLADIPHTMPTPVTGVTEDPAQMERLGLVAARYEGPTGIVGVLADTVRRAGLTSISLWAGVPHYLLTGTNPRAALELVRRLSLLLEVEVETDTLARAGVSWEEQVSAMIEENDDLRAYVRRLEESASEREGGFGAMPDGKELVEELERFLREQRGNT